MNHQPSAKIETVGVTMTSPPDHRHTGLRITRRISLQPNTSTLRLDLESGAGGLLTRWRAGHQQPVLAEHPY